jgi:hypothetical protein
VLDFAGPVVYGLQTRYVNQEQLSTFTLVCEIRLTIAVVVVTGAFSPRNAPALIGTCRDQNALKRHDAGGFPGAQVAIRATIDIGRTAIG